MVIYENDTVARQRELPVATGPGTAFQAHMVTREEQARRARQHDLIREDWEERTSRQNEADDRRELTREGQDESERQFESDAKDAARSVRIGNDASELAQFEPTPEPGPSAVDSDALLALMQVSLGVGANESTIVSGAGVSPQAEHVYERFPELRPPSDSNEQSVTPSAHARRVYARFPELDPTRQQLEQVSVAGPNY